MNSRVESVNGSSRSSAASTMLKTAVLAPMPIAMIATATSENPGAFSSERSAYRMSHHVALASHAAADEPVAPEGTEIEAGSATGHHIRKDAAGGRRMLKAVAAEAVDQKQTVDPARGADDRIAVGG